LDADDRSALIVPLTARGRTFGAMTLVAETPQRRYDGRDLTFAEELARRAALALDNARLYREAQEAVEAREKFLSIASHELKTPLTVLRLAAQALERIATGGGAAGASGGAPPGPDRAVAAARKITENVERLARIVDDLLDVSRMMAGRMELRIEPVDLVALVRETVARLGELAARSGCEVRLHLPDSLVGTWDRQRLDQVLTNLLTNALKYGHGKPVDVTVERHGGRAVLAVRDHGIGIAEEAQARIFEPYERAAGAGYAGTGLGLWIVRQILEALGGTIAVTSRPGAGATFVVTLRLDS
jgi:signal transduction histidine kinase